MRAWIAGRTPRIAIVGAGVGGFTLALALRRYGLAAEIFEQAGELHEIGAAVALSANATRELERLDLLDTIAGSATEPSELIYRDGRDGRAIAAHPVRRDGRYRARFGAPYFGIHRADLQHAFSAAFGREGLHLGHHLSRLVEAPGALRLEFANGHVHEADLVVGADGVRSVVRQWITGHTGTVYSGTSAFRGIVPVAHLPSLPDPQAIQFWMGPGAHLLHYAIGPAGGMVNFFAVVEEPAIWPDAERWQIAAQPGEAVAAFAGWHPAVTQMVGAGWLDKRWGLFVVQQPSRWHRGRAVLIGDAAHGMLPHQGQGANTTIEDAITLAALLAANGTDDPGALFARYEGLRRARTRKIQRSSWATNRALHLPDGPNLAARDARVARFPEDFGWIHAFDALGAVGVHPS